MLLVSRIVTVDRTSQIAYLAVIMNAMTVTAQFVDFRPAYWQLQPIERKFVDGYVADIETIADKTGQRLLAVLQAPFPYELDGRAVVLLALPMVRAAIAERIKELSDLYDISIYRTLKELTSIAYANINNYIDINQVTGTPEINLSRCTPEMLSAVKSFEIEDKPRGGRKYKFQLHDKITALAHVMRYQGLLSDENQHWRQVEQSVKPESQSRLPVGVSDDAAAKLYADAINSS